MSTIPLLTHVMSLSLEKDSPARNNRGFKNATNQYRYYFKDIPLELIFSIIFQPPSVQKHKTVKRHILSSCRHRGKFVAAAL
jgi:hypothetical protein